MNPNHTHRSLRILTFCALLVAMSIVFSRVLSISTGFLRFNLGSLPVVLAAVLFGPGAGFVVGALADAIGGVLAGYAINPLITLGAGAVGFFAGWGWRHLPVRTDGLRLAGGIAFLPGGAGGICPPAPTACGWPGASCWGTSWARWCSTRWRCACSTAMPGACWPPASPTRWCWPGRSLSWCGPCWPTTP